MRFAPEFDNTKQIKLTGVVTKVDWTNPHVWFYFNVKDESGAVTTWGAEMGPRTCFRVLVGRVRP
jgi:hypothetical protein